MRLFSLFKKRETIEKNKSMIISEIEQLSTCIKENKIIVINGENIHLIEPVLFTLENSKNDFAFYDPIINSSGSDPGAYFSYSYDLENNIWKMTYGNHGWTGGIYRIEKKILVKQIENIIQVKKYIELDIYNVAFFSHYKNKSISENKEMNNKLSAIHD